jgi:hypothetical protein
MLRKKTKYSQRHLSNEVERKGEPKKAVRPSLENRQQEEVDRKPERKGGLPVNEAS